MSWGKGIALALFAFVVFISTLVTIIISQKVDLVSEDYYKNEIAFQEEIDARSRGNTLEPYKTVFNDKYLIFNFPNQKDMDSIQVVLFRPNNKKMDQHFIVKDANPLVIPQEILVKGFYQIECYYFQNGERLSQFGDIIVE